MVIVLENCNSTKVSTRVCEVAAPQAAVQVEARQVSAEELQHHCSTTAAPLQHSYVYGWSVPMGHAAEQMTA
jgi:hypothetical protein